MFVRNVKIPSSSGTIHEYVRVVESVREQGRVKQKVVANLGRRDVLEAMLPALNRLLKGEDAQEELARQIGQVGPIQVVDSSTWGPMMVVRHFFAQLELWKILDARRRWPHLLPKEDPDDDWPSRVLALVSNRLTHPCSEHALAGWLETDYVCDRQGSRYVPKWEQKRRVQVSQKQLQRWYRTLDHLLDNKDDIEVALYHRLRNLFEFQPDLVLYDLTSVYFEGHGPPLAKHGYSRDGKPRNVQVVVGVVMVAGWPIAHHVWEGNTKDGATVGEVVEDLSKRFDFRQVIFVGDRGMVSESNLEVLTEADGDWGFLLGMNRRRNPEAEALLDRIDEKAWILCPVGVTAAEKKNPPATRVQEVTCDRQGVRVFVVDSDERREYKKRMREKAMARVLEGLKKVQARVAKGQLKKPEKIGAAVERTLQRNHGHRYYDWRLGDGKLEIFEHPLNLPREKKYEGKYLIQTDQSHFTPQDALAYYKDLSEVERGFRSMKNPLSLRPIWHRSEDRVKAHIFVAALAFLIERMLERSLKRAKVKLSAQQALQALQTIRFVSFDINGQRRTGVTQGSARARQVLKALKLTDSRPPTPPEGRETTM